MKPNHSEKRKRSILRDRPVVLAISVLVLILGIVGTTLGFLTDKTAPVTNTFTPAKAEISVEETLTNGVKNNVKIKNESDTFPVFIRARVIVTWKDEAGNVAPTAPTEGTDYTIEWKDSSKVTGSNWVKHSGGNYYHTAPVEKDAFTDVLFTSCQPVDGKAPEGYHLSVEIVADCIQAKPAQAVKDAWGLDVKSDGTLRIPVTTPEGGND